MTTAKPAAPVARDADAELEALFAAIDDVILVLDAEGRYVKIAPTNPSLLYRPAAELLGKTLREVFDAAQAEQFMEYIRTALATRTTGPTPWRCPAGPCNDPVPPSRQSCAPCTRTGAGAAPRRSA